MKSKQIYGILFMLIIFFFSTGTSCDDRFFYEVTVKNNTEVDLMVNSAVFEHGSYSGISNEFTVFSTPVAGKSSETIKFSIPARKGKEDKRTSGIILSFLKHEDWINQLDTSNDMLQTYQGADDKNGCYKYYNISELEKKKWIVEFNGFTK